MLLLTGSAGGGKSRFAAEKVHAFCLKYPGAMGLVLRKVKVSMTSGAVLMLDKTVIGPTRYVRHRPSKSRFEYLNGSILAYGGLADEEQQERLKSIGQDGGVDIVWMEEATEFEESDLNTVLARMRGKAAPWRQLMLSCNPDAPTHFIKRRLIDGKEATIYYSSAADNPNNPDDYIETLDLLTGIERDRLVLGKWVQAVGVVYEGWVDAPGALISNVTEDAEYIPGAGPIYWALDDGYAGKLVTDKETGKTMFTAGSHPRAILLCQQRPTGQLVCFAESYHIEMLSDAHISRVLELGYPLPDLVVIGPGAAEIRGRLYEAGLDCQRITVEVEERVKEMRRWIAPDKNGFIKFIVHPRCAYLRADMASYSRDDHGKLIKDFDHGPDAIGYLIWKLRYE